MIATNSTASLQIAPAAPAWFRRALAFDLREGTMRILVVEDDESIREMLRDVLEMRGHSVVEAETLGEATELLDSSMIELALVDGQFPKGGTSGRIENFGPLVCQAARGLGARTVLMSADPGLVEAERRRGYPALLKPFTLAALQAAVEQQHGAVRT